MSVDDELFSDHIDHYEAWYDSDAGHRAEIAEQQLLRWLFHAIGETTLVLEIGCGTGRFARFMALAHDVIGIDLSEAMLTVGRSHQVIFPVVRGDAVTLPFGDNSVDVSVFVTSLEFIADVEQALREAVRVSRRGVIAIVLNRYSRGGIRRRSRKGLAHITAHAHDFSLKEIKQLLRTAAGDRFASLCWRSGLFPFIPASVRVPLAAGDTIGIGLTLGAV